MRYRVSTNRSGDKRWWSDSEVIPETHSDIRPATAEEAAVMDKIVHAKGMPSLALGERITRTLADSP
jgi:hypothetical protein